ncbi:AAA-like domain-containing protein [[Phormidium] sp. ETS-05]|uniref:AAA-like domain-containing protein n=1 Tax=[Phormidium] sp. ETS-05 TaxID=222819 RepID=UPI0018EEDFEE|nr:AAA-like domain-containing protein [[Phormidium] sp. ETS-05]
MPRSLKIRLDCIPLVKSSLLRNGFPSQKILAEDLGISQSTVSNFLNGRPVDYVNFQEICRVLAQEWRQIADLNGGEPKEELPPSGGNVPVRVAIASGSHPITLVEELHRALQAAGHEVFLPENNGKPTTYLSKSDYLLLLLSAEGAISELILDLVRLAKQLHQITSQKPAILPICVDGSGMGLAMPFDLQWLLEGVQPWRWRSATDTPVIISELLGLFAEGGAALASQHHLALRWEDMPKMMDLVPVPMAPPELPEGQVEVDSEFYIYRPPIEERCWEAIGQPGALIRIKAPRQMGKTSLMARILSQAERQGSRSVALSFQLANQRVFANSDRFLQWFCASISLELGLLDQEKLAKYAQLAQMIGSNQSCRAYFEQYLLPEIRQPLTLGLDEVDRVFESPEIADDFFGLLRSLHEEAKRRDIWKNLRLVVVHSTEVYIPLDVNKSPFNVGLPIELPEFNPNQVQELAWRHGLSWQNRETEKLMSLVGGHPYLVRLGMYHIARGDVTLDDLLTEGATEAGLYADHLRRHLWNLEQHRELLDAMALVVATPLPVRLPSALAFKLNSMGLVKVEGNDCAPRCLLYRQYFRDRLSPR